MFIVNSEDTTMMIDYIHTIVGKEIKADVEALEQTNNYLTKKAKELGYSNLISTFKAFDIEKRIIEGKPVTREEAIEDIRFNRFATGWCGQYDFEGHKVDILHNDKDFIYGHYIEDETLVIDMTDGHEITGADKDLLLVVYN